VALSPGTKLGSYEISALIGVGGMGEVYRATDTNLKRQVAIKVLPDLVAADAERVARFQREAEVLAALNHPNIAHIHGLERSRGTIALVMELVEGPTLADRIAQGPIPVDEVLPIAKQIAEALETAHEQGIIHRDLKPTNIKVRADGTVKVLDFGLAKVMEPTAPLSTSVPQSPTITTPAMTQAGVILGTAAYMSPEQARGQPIDKRTDIWAFGCVLYEMLAGRPAFARATVSDTLAAVLGHEPDWSAAPEMPLHVHRVLRRCLTKDVKQRLRDVGDARADLEEASLSVPAMSAQPIPRLRMRAWHIVLLVAVALAAIAAAYVRTLTTIPETRLDLTTPSTNDPASFAVSPDGRTVAFVASVDGVSRLWVRSLASAVPHPLEGTEGGAFPFWSPDGRSIGFFADGSLKRIEVAGGAPQTLAKAANGRGGDWNDEGTILFTPSAASPLFRVPASGGQPVAVTQLKAPEHASHRFPRFLADGRRFLFFVRGSPGARGIYAGSLNTTDIKLIRQADTAPVLVGAEYLLSTRQAVLFAQRIDANASIVGDEIRVEQRVAVYPGFDLAAVSASPTGVIAYRSEPTGGRRQLLWLDRSGREIGRIGAPDAATPRSPNISPDGRAVTFDRTVNGNRDIWVVELARGAMRRVTSDASAESNGSWSPDGKRLAFGSNRRGAFDLYERRLEGAEQDHVLLVTPFGKGALDWSPDGRFLLYFENEPDTGTDLWILPREPNAKPLVFVQTPVNEVRGEFSPDGKSIAYDSNESGRFEVYVRRFPAGVEKRQVSTNGGAQPRWRPDGKEIYYVAPDLRLMAVSVIPSVDGTSVEIAGVTPLFTVPFAEGAVPGSERQQYDVSSNGRFLINAAVDEEVTPPIRMILNWKP
jgi:eukaryotic-like serine/threonine-protein kinase